MHASVSRNSAKTPRQWAIRIAAWGATRKRLFKGIEATLFCLVVLLLILICLQVISRYVIQVSLPWTEESARITLLWTVMLGAAVAMERREHYAITIVSDLLVPPVDRIVTVAVNLIGLVFLAVFCVYGIKYAESGMRNSYVSLGIPRGWIYLALPFGSGLMALSLISQSIEALFGEVPKPGAETGIPDEKNLKAVAEKAAL